MSEPIHFERVTVAGVTANHVKHFYQLTVRIPFGQAEEVEEELRKVDAVTALADAEDVSLVRLTVEPYQSQLPLMPPVDSGPDALTRPSTSLA